MELKILKPITPSQRHLIRINKTHLNKKPIIKNKIIGLKNSSGRNNSGKITIRHKGGGHKRRYRKINFSRIKNSTAIVASIEYDPNRNANIAAVYNFSNTEFFYILAPKHLNVGDIIQSGINAKPGIGNSLPISNIPIGSPIHNISLKTSKPAQISRSAGSFSILKEKTLHSAKIELSSKEERIISSNCFATMGIVSNDFYFLLQLGKAGRSRWLNKRPTIRGVAMNPVDHPHGGGEGKKSGNSMTPWGKSNKGRKTSKSRKK